MVALYDSFIYPFVVFFYTRSGYWGILALNLSLSNLSLFALLGLIMLMGLVVKNAILIVDFTNQLKAEGMHFKEALVQRAKKDCAPF
jgi:HAE1 family hydrophobic/amphiphilic exporter-1